MTLLSQGEEIFNTYGEVSNLHLMHMYGFAEQFPANRNDVVEIPVIRMLEAAQELNPNHKLTLDKWTFLQEQDIISEDDVFVINKDGFVTDDTCLQALKVLALNDEEFKDYAEKEGWSDAESDTSVAEDSKLAFVNLLNLDSRWKQILIRTAQLHLNQYIFNLEEDDKHLQQVSNMTSRQRTNGAMAMENKQKTQRHNLMYKYLFTR
ncbi:N-lysine methyltransferase setd6 [Bulinus truncatus]|nr:N-lysine methyltransferase setd6 [Bulinus truncatus]